MIFGSFRDEPWYGKNTGLMEGLSTGLRHVELTGGHFLSVPGPRATKRSRRAAIHLGNAPQRAGRGHDQTQRVGAYDALALAPLSLPETIEGMGVAHVNCDDPALAILVHDVLEAHGEIGGEKGLDRRRGFAVAPLGGGAFGLASYDHDPHAAPGPHRVPQALPGWKLGAVLTGVRRPTRGGVRQGLGRADPGAFVAWGPATLWGREWLGVV